LFSIPPLLGSWGTPALAAAGSGCRVVQNKHSIEIGA